MKPSNIIKDWVSTALALVYLAGLTFAFYPITEVNGAIYSAMALPAVGVLFADLRTQRKK